MKLILIILLATFVTIGNARNLTNSNSNSKYKRDGCYAPPSFYGGVCYSQEGLFGSSGFKIKYCFDQIGDVNMQCKGLGAISDTQWGMIDMGVFQPGGCGTLNWGDAAGKPGVQCKGLPTGTSFNWNWS